MAKRRIQDKLDKVRKPRVHITYEVELPPGDDGDRPAPEIVRKAMLYDFIYGVLGLISGLAAIVLGALLTVNGIIGSTSWTAKFMSLQSNINDATPGVMLFIIGLFLIYVTKPRVKVLKVKG
jgi:uncharacterized BrkB/YihY/UPF0761 family membrane protein